MLNSKLGKIQFWLLFTGFHATFLVQHWTGVQGQVRRTANYPDLPGDVTTLNIISTAGSWVLSPSVLLFLWNVYVTWRSGQRVTEDDPWGYCSSLEWVYLLSAAAAHFLPHPADPVRAAGVRPALSAHQDRARVTRARASHPGASR